MTQLSSKVKDIAIIVVLLGALIMPATASASWGSGWFNWWSDWWGSARKGNDNSGETVGVPEFSIGAASGAGALLIGGSLVLLGRRRKKEKQ